MLGAGVAEHGGSGGIALGGCTLGPRPRPCPWPPAGAWIITGGSHAGVMKQVGEAVRDFSLSSGYKEGEVVTIGVATWGTIHNREGLVHPTVSGHPGGRGAVQGRGLPGCHSERARRDPVTGSKAGRMLGLSLPIAGPAGGSGWCAGEDAS